MGEETSRYFDQVILLSQSTFESVEFDINRTPERSILKIQARYGQFRIFVTELFSDERRKYRYYVLQKDWVKAGFDNSPDPRALYLKYGKIGKKHTGENIPHLHLDDKNLILLTEEMTFESFVDWLLDNL